MAMDCDPGLDAHIAKMDRGQRLNGIRAISARITSLRKAIEYLETCGQLTFEKLAHADELSGIAMDRAELRQLWVLSERILPNEGRPGGQESMRGKMIKVYAEAITQLEGVTAKLRGSSPRKRWWQFWRR